MDRKMSERLRALVELARQVETDPDGLPNHLNAKDSARALAKLVLDFVEDHVMVARHPANGDTIEALVPFASPLRDIDSATGKPSWTIAPTAVVTVLQRAIPLLVRLGDYVGNSDNEGRGGALCDAHDALSAIGADVPNAYPKVVQS